MTDRAAVGGAGLSLAPVLFAVAVFSSAALVFLLEPMVGQLLLPRLGGSPSVWNTSLMFFQAALLLGYAYAHLLQRLGDVRRQMLVHLIVLATAGLALPLHLSAAVGPGSTAHPVTWLLAELTLSVGAPFAALSATAPLLQAWYARVGGGQGGPRDPYVLYAASNLGSLLALLSYPFVMQPLMGLRGQAGLWTAGYAAFAVLVLALAVAGWRRGGDTVPVLRVTPKAAAAPATVWRERLVWVLLAGAPSSLLLGVTTHITTDVASAPFLWVLPLALYLLTFVVAFQARPLIAPSVALLLQAPAVAVSLMFIPIKTTAWLPLLAAHLISFFLTALVCHQSLARRRPSPERLTEFYLLMSFGGVVGGAFNALAAPVIFNDVWEYPLVLVLAALARPWGRGMLTWRSMLLMMAGIGCAAFVAYPHMSLERPVEFAMFGVIMVTSFLLRDRAPFHALLLAALAVAAPIAESRYDVTESRRSFFGVITIGEMDSPELGPVRFMMHGSTLHGSQAEDPALRCTPETYYAPNGPIGRTVLAEQAARPGVRFGVVGLGTGTIAAYVRPTDAMRFFEIDPLVVRLASDPSLFTYLHGCARGPVSLTMGDARLSLAGVPDASFDMLLVDAFSSDSVPVHLLTVQAMKRYLKVIRPDGVVILHLSNRNLDLTGPAAAAVAAAGGVSLQQVYLPPPHTPAFQEAGVIALMAARTPQALARFGADPRWTPTDQPNVRAWTDDYSNVLGALIERMRHPPLISRAMPAPRR